jgi:Leucine-rich repeat (LRR) protein
MDLGRRPIALLLALAIAPAAARWCQVENVKSDIYNNYSYAGPWRLDGCTTLALDHGYCAEVDCPWRIKFDNEAIIELADQLHGNSQLTALSISSNKLTDESAVALAEALRNNQVLSDINLQGNQIGDQGALALAEVLETNTYCTVLNLEFNLLTDEAGQALLSVLKSNQSALEMLYLANNKISEDIVDEAAEESKAALRPPADHRTAALPKSEL